MADEKPPVVKPPRTPEMQLRAANYEQHQDPADYLWPQPTDRTKLRLRGKVKK
jgi:hypothetical protein